MTRVLFEHPDHPSWHYNKVHRQYVRGLTEYEQDVYGAIVKIRRGSSHELASVIQSNVNAVGAACSRLFMQGFIYREAGTPPVWGPVKDREVR